MSTGKPSSNETDGPPRDGGHVVGEGAHPSSAGQVRTSAQDASPLDQDDKALEMREQGRSYAAIARALGLPAGLDANAAFNRALRRQPNDEQDLLRGREAARLDALSKRVRLRSDIDEAEVARKVRSIERLKKRLYTA